MARRDPRKWLREALAEKRWTQTELEKRLTLTSGTVSRWLSGEKKPERDSAVGVEMLLGIPVAAWSDAKDIPRTGTGG